jgi:polar amino acid transport system substrate-binding protein
MRPGALPRLLACLSALVLLGVSPCSAWAACSRPILVPSAQIGLSVIVRGNEVSGIFPEFLNQVGREIGCTFIWSAVPRARLEVLFETGAADILMPATASPKRDLAGTFVPTLETRAFLVSIASGRPPVENMAQLLQRRELRVALVRGFDYGPAYQNLAAELTKQGRLRLESNPAAVIRLLQEGLTDVAILTPITVHGAITTDARLTGVDVRVRFEELPELQWHRSGIYLSNKLPAADLALLEKGILAADSRGALIQAYKRTYPPHIFTLGTRPVSPLNTR